MHIELIHAEAILLRSFVNIINDETFMSVIRGGLQMRSSYNSYKQLMALIESTAAAASTSAAHQADMKSGVYLGIGGFNIILSLLPARVLRLVEFLGFSSSRSLGLQVLEEGGSQGGLRSILNDLIFMGFYLVVAGFLELPRTKENLELVKKVLDRDLKRYPTGVIVLYFKAKYLQVIGDPTGCIQVFRYRRPSIVARVVDLFCLPCRSVLDAKLSWVQLYHLCFWELLWSYAFVQDWDNAIDYSTRLLHNNKCAAACTCRVFSSVRPGGPSRPTRT